MKNNLILLFVSAYLFTACNSVDHEQQIESKKELIELTTNEKERTIKKGKEVAQNVFQVLGGHLKKAMANGGVENAINFCNANANHLMDSLSAFHDARIRRTSLKLRNDNNQPSEAELAVLNSYAEGEATKPIVDLLENGNIAFYAPIKMKPLCISCHGTVGTTISEKDYSFISKHYPNDKAVGYKEGDFRGIWSIEFEK